MPITFYQHLLAQFYQSILREQARITQSAKFLSYCLYRNEVMGLQKPLRMYVAILGGRGQKGALSLKFKGP